MKEMTGADGTGGVFVNWDKNTFDLAGLPIADAVTGGYLVKYRGTADGNEKEVRLVIDDGDSIRGEATQNVSY